MEGQHNEVKTWYLIISQRVLPSTMDGGGLTHFVHMLMLQVGWLGEKESVRL